MKAALIGLAIGMATVLTASPAPRSVSAQDQLQTYAPSGFAGVREDRESEQRSLELAPSFYRALRGP